MIEQIHFLLNLHIYLINIIIEILFIIIFRIELKKINTSSRFIAEISKINKNSLFFTSFLLLCSFCFVFFIGNINFNFINDLILPLFYFLLLIIMIYNNYQAFLIIKKEKDNCFLIELDIPNLELEKMEYLYSIIQGLFSFIILLLIIKIAIRFLKLYEECILGYYENGRMFLFFEMRQNIV